MKENLGRIEVNQKIMVGKPVIKGTRVTVDAILQRIKEGLTIQDILDEYPKLTKEDIKAALEYASRILSGEEIIPIVR